MLIELFDLKFIFYVLVEFALPKSVYLILI